MTEERFWNLIEQARPSKAASANPKRMAEVLSALSSDEVIDFGAAFYEKVCLLNHWNIWGAGYVISGGMGDDSFHYFRSWIVGKGKAVFDVALGNPDELGPFIDGSGVDNELLEYAPIEVLQQRGSDVDPRDRLSGSADADPVGEPFDEATVHLPIPKLSAQFH